MICRNRKYNQEIPDESSFCLHCGARQAAKKRTARKRPPGAGSITKLSGKRSKPYQAFGAAVTNSNGDTIRPFIGTFSSYAEADAAIYDNKASQALPAPSEYYDYTLKQIYDEYTKTRDFTDLSKDTQNNYNAAIKYYAPLYDWKFRNLRRPQFQQPVNDAEALGRSRSTCKKIKVIGTILSNFALENDVIQKSYAKKIRLAAEEKKNAPEYFTELEIAKLLKNLDDPIVRMTVVMIFTGMRISEETSLTKFSVDLDEMLITGGIKTDAGKDRIIPIHPTIQPIFRECYQSCENYIFEETVTIGNVKKGTSRTIKKPYQYEHFCDLYYAALERVGVRRLTPHKARHTFFTRLDAKCQDKLGMAMVGGHSDPNFTERIYVHPDVDRLRDVIACL